MIAMELNDFRLDMISNARSAAEVKQDFVRTCFVEDAGSRLTEAEEFIDFHVCHFEGSGRRNRRLQIDGYAIDETDGSVTLVIAEFFNDDNINSFGSAEARRAFASLRAFVEDALEGCLTDGSIDEAQPGYGFARDLAKLLPSILRFRFYLVSDGQLSTRASGWDEEEIQGIPVEFHIWDVSRFHRAHESASGRDSLEITFAEYGVEGIPCLGAENSQGEYQAFLCMVPGELLAKIYDKYGGRLLEGNVRSFLSTKGKVNAGIQSTIVDRPNMFFAYNNGVAATAEAIELSKGANSKIVAAKNLQIVNGGQTTASLAAALRAGADLSKVSVQMKLSVLPPEKAGDLIPLIARFANSQNKVNDADFFANHPYHVRLEELSRRLWTPAPAGKQHGSRWFYERARGQFLNEQSGLTMSQKAQFLLLNPKAQLLTKTDIAKLENTWRGYPHKVSLGAQKNFLFFAEWVAKSWADSDEQFDEQYFRYLASIAILFRSVEALISKQPWYQGGYRANIVTYSIAKLQFMILKQAKGCELDFRKIWDEQAISHELQNQILIIAKRVFDVLTDPSRPKDNVTEWAKMAACWTQVQALDLALDLEIVTRSSNALLDNAIKEQSLGIQPVGFGLFAKTAVMGVDGTEWAVMRQWGVDKRILSTRESDLLRAASRLPKFVPSAKDCERILKIKNKLLNSGFDITLSRE